MRMPLVAEMVHPRGLSFAMQRKVVLLRDVKGQTWPEIASQVRNLAGKRAPRSTCQRVYKMFSARDGRVRSKYKNCGTKPHKVTKAVERFLLRRLRELRRKTVCTSVVLQHDLARQKRVKVTARWVRKVLGRNGFHWLPKRQKRRYSAAQRAQRMAFAKKVLALSARRLRERLSFAMDGVVLALPPVDPTDRWNFCRYGNDHMWRKRSEGLRPALSGNDPYGKQVPLPRALPMWGGCSAGGFAPVVFHKTKKLKVAEWQKAVASGKLAKAIKALKPVKPTGPWLVLCDNESFLRAKVVSQAHKESRVTLWHIPAKSPDLNPVERVWAWLRKKLRAMDLEDASKKRKVLSKAAYRARVRRVLKTKKAQGVAAKCAKGLRAVCRELIKKKGAATSG